MISQENKLLTVNDVSKELGISPYLLRRGIKSGRFPAFRVSESSRYLLDIKVIAKILGIEYKQTEEDSLDE